MFKDWRNEEMAMVLGRITGVRKVLHGNLATIAGNRMVINAYCSKTTVDRISK